MGGAEHNSIIMKSERGAVADGWMAVELKELQLEHQEPSESKKKKVYRTGERTTMVFPLCIPVMLVFIV